MIAVVVVVVVAAAAVAAAIARSGIRSISSNGPSNSTSAADPSLGKTSVEHAITKIVSTSSITTVTILFLVITIMIFTKS